jgi:hypothetical protein
VESKAKDEAAPEQESNTLCRIYHWIGNYSQAEISAQEGLHHRDHNGDIMGTTWGHNGDNMGLQPKTSSRILFLIEEKQSLIRTERIDKTEREHQIRGRD